MSGLRWKVCGITNARDAALAVSVGADALGFVLWPGSPRSVTLGDAETIARELPERVWRVGVFVDPTPAELEEAAERIELDYLQLHGDETPAACAFAPRPVWKALRLGPGTSPEQARRQAAPFEEVTLVVDAAVPGAYGGTGRRADWTAAAHLAGIRRVVLAGGLRPDNVAAAIEQVKPWGVDVSSGVEAAPGRKDNEKLQAFADAVEGYR